MPYSRGSLSYPGQLPDQGVRKRRRWRSRWWVGLTLLLGLASLTITTALYRAEAPPAVVTTQVGRGPLAVAVDAQSGHAFAVNCAADTVSMLDTRTAMVVQTVGVVAHPRAVVVDSRTHRAFVVNGQGAVSVLDTATGTVLRTVAGLNESSTCYNHACQSCSALALVSDEQTGHLFVAAIRRPGSFSAPLPVNAVSTLDGRSGAVLNTVGLGHGSGMDMVLAARAGRVFVTDRADGTVSVLDAATGHAIRTVSLDTQLGATASDERSQHVFVASSSDNTVSMLDARSGRRLRTITLPAQPAGLADDEQTGRLFVTTTDDTLRILDARSGALLHTVTAGKDPTTVVVDGLRRRVFVLNRSDGAASADSVSVLDATSGRLLRRVVVGRLAGEMALDATSGRLLVVNQGGAGAPGTSGASRWQWMPVWLRRFVPWLKPAAPAPDTGSVTVLNLSRL